MDEVGVIAVVGVCGPERFGYAKRLAKLTNRAFLPAARLAGSPDPAQEAAVLASWTDPRAGVVVEFPDEVPATELIGTLVDENARTRLLGLACVVDAGHVLEDLQRDDYLPLRDAESGVASPLVARAELTVTQIEYASTIVLVNWRTRPSAELAILMALLSHLSPRARMRLQRDVDDDLDIEAPYTAEQERAGWMCMLNGGFDPHMTDRRVSSFRYEQVRPLHPGRLKRLLDERIESGDLGTIVRSVGFCRLATRAKTVAHWEHTGRVFSLNPVAIDDHLEGEEELLSVGQDLVITGLDVDQDRLTTALDEAALTDEEFAAGAAAWTTFPDPFPFWATVGDRSE